MVGKILLEVVTPEKLLLSQEVDEVSAPGSEGEFGVLPGQETQVMRIRVSPEVLKTIIHDVTYSGETFGVYSSMTQTLTGNTNHTSLLRD